MKTIAKRLIAAVAAMTMLIPSASVWAAKGNTDVDIAAGKPAVSACYGTDSYAGGNVTNVTSGSGIFVSDGGWNAENIEIITIDLGARYPINQIDVWNYYGYEAVGSDPGRYPSDVMFDFYVTNTAPANQKDAPADAVKLESIGDKFIKCADGGFNSHFQLADVASYRYVQLRLLSGTGKNTAFRIGQINVWTTAEAAVNVPTVVSVGKPMWGNNLVWTGMGESFDRLYKLNDGDLTNQCGLYNWGDTAGKPELIMDLEAKYPIEKVVVTKPSNGTVDGVLVSNDPTFTSSVPLSYDASNNEYYLNAALVPVFGSDFRYVMVKVTNGAWGNDWYTVGLNEISVYSTSQAAAAAAKPVNIALGKTAKSTAGDGAFPTGYNAESKAKNLANLVDGTTGAFYYNEGENNYITLDLGAAYPVETIKTEKVSNAYGEARDGKISAVKLSNDPNFNEDSVLVLDGHRYFNTTDANEFEVRYSFSQSAVAGEAEKYRYVRIYDDSTNGGKGWQIDEVYVYVQEEAASLKNASLDSTATFINGGGVAGGSLEALLDGNSSTHCYSYGGMAVIKLPYPMTIKQIEVDSRPGYDDLAKNFTNLGGYNIWLSHEALTGDSAASMPAGTVKVSSATRTDQTGERLYHAGATVVTEVEDETKYSYVTVQCPGNGEFYIYDVRILSNDVIEGSTITNELTGEQAKGEVLTLTTSWRCEVAPTETVNLYIARYDNGALTDVKKSADKTLSGQTGSETFEYTITEDVTAQTEFKGFVWEKGTLNPFA